MITRLERKIIELLEKYYKVICFVCLIVLSLVVRYLCRGFVSWDASAYLIPWYETIKNSGGFNALNQQVGDYNMLYQTIISLLTYIPIKELYGYKILSILFDYLLASVVAYIIYTLTDNKRELKAKCGFLITIMSPIVIMNSSVWAQCDSIYVFFCCCTILCIIKEKYSLAFILWGIAFSFKLQAVFLLPFVVLIYLYKKRFSILYSLMVPITMVILAIPNFLAGRRFKELFTLYLSQVNKYEMVSINYPSALLILANGSSDGITYDIIKYLSIMFLFIFFVFVYGYLLNRQVDFSNKTIMYVAFLTTYICVLFLPSMHERYGFLYEILAIIVLVLNKKTIIPFFLLYGITCYSYGRYLFNLDMPMNSILGIINIIIFIIYSVILLKDISQNHSDSAVKSERL